MEINTDMKKACERRLYLVVYLEHNGTLFSHVS